ncbi:MAG: ribonuclease PH [Candidatus Omnitrophica bacterium]|nr:ribonuclease PH [Candidatus Omnitrophota bacterium]
MLRENNRGLKNLRKITIQRNYSKYAEGSCLIELGNTRLVCTVSVDNTVPPFLRDTGTGWVTAEYGMLPRSCNVRLSRDKMSGRTYEIQRLIGRSLRAVIDMNRLGERTLRIDCDVIQADGGTRTAAISGAFVALVDALDGLKRQGVFRKLPIKDYLAATSVGKIGSDILLDLSYEEDSKADVDMNVVMTGSGEFVEVQATGENSSFSRKEIDAFLQLAKEGIDEIIQIQKKTLANVI